MININYDTTPSRRELARTQVDRAIRLAPRSTEAQLASATYLKATNQPVEAERRLRELLELAPADHRVLRMLARVCDDLDKSEEALSLIHRCQSLPGGDVEALNDECYFLRTRGRILESLAVAERSLLKAPSKNGYEGKLIVLAFFMGDLAAARAHLEKIPTPLLLEDSFANQVAKFWLDSGEGEKAVEFLGRVPRDFFEERNTFVPKSYQAGWALRLTGRDVAAHAEWRQALLVVDKHLTGYALDSSNLYPHNHCVGAASLYLHSFKCHE
jgi:tetratricopeptide (TPR) repeat protein